MTVRIIGGLMLAVWALLTSSCYIAGQGYHFLGNQLVARPIEKLQRNGAITAEEGALFQQVEQIRTFGRQTLGLSGTDSYRSYVRSGKSHLVNVVSAADTISFTRKEWWFPVVGRVPYKGYYRPEPARRLAQRLKDKGWDVVLRRVDAFSSLGYFKDPLYDFMVAYEEAYLAELILHEMLHATIWVNDASQFNEELATFVGQAGAAAYLEARYGRNSSQLVELEASRRDRTRFRNDMFLLREELERLYRSASTDTPPKQILNAKAEIIAEARATFQQDYDTLYHTERYRTALDGEINNAWIDLFHTYSAGVPRLETFHREAGDGDLATTINLIMELMTQREELPRNERPDPMAMIDAYERGI